MHVPRAARRSGVLAATLLLLVLSWYSAIVPPVAAADPPYTGFLIDSETGNRFGGGQLHDHFPESLTATGTTSDVAIAGSGWTFDFRQASPLTVGTYYGGGSIFRVRLNGTFCSSFDWTYQIFEAPVAVDGVITQFAADFWRPSCGLGDPGAAIVGSIRVGSSIPPAMLHVTSRLDFPDTYAGEVAVDKVISVQNAGETTIDVQPIVASGTESADFPIDDGCGTVSLDPGQSCTITVGFAPTDTTQRSAIGTLTSTAYGPARAIDLTGYGLSPLLKTPNALVIDGQPGVFTNGEHWYDPTAMTVSGVEGALHVDVEEWDLDFETGDGQPLAVGTYADADLAAGGNGPVLRVTRGLRLCSEAYVASFTVIEAPVIDVDGTVLRFAADYQYSCPETAGRVIRGWLRFHSDVERPVEETLSYAIDVDTGASAPVGETITMTPQITGTDFLDGARCVMFLNRDDPGRLQWMQVASDGCQPWTLTIPASDPGSYSVKGFLMTRDGGQEHFLEAPSAALAITSGTPTTFTSNYPVQSWAVADLLSDPTPAFGSPVTIHPASGLDGCRLSVFGGMEHVATYQRGSCADWNVTLRAPTPDAVASFYGDRADVMAIGWVGESDWSDQRIDAPFVGSIYAATYNSLVPTFTGTGGSYASNLPAVFSDAARGNVYYTDDPTTHHFAPVVLGATSGTCTSDRAPNAVAVIGGACAAFDVPPTTFTGNVSEGIRFALYDGAGVVVAETSTDIGFIDRMPTLALTVPGQVGPGAAVPVQASTSAGVPASYQVVVTPVTLAATGSSAPAAISGPTSYSGTFDPSLGSSGESIGLSVTGLAAGTWDVKATFRDVLGATVTSTKRVSVGASDTTPPTVTSPRRGFVVGTTVSTSSRISLRLPWTGSDTGSGIARYELAQQTDGGAWTTVSTSLISPSATHSLTTGHTYAFRVRGVDKAGNMSGWATGATFKVTRYQETSSRITYAGTWKTATGTRFLGGAAKKSSSVGAKASITFTGRSIAWVARKGPDRGKAAVYVNGIKVATVDLYAASYQDRRVAWVGAWTTTVSRKVTIKVLGTSGRPRVDLDAFVTAN